MKILIPVFIFLIGACSNVSIASAVEARRLEDMANILDKEARKVALVIFDVDDTLIMPTDEFAFREPIRKRLYKELTEKYSKERVKLLFSDFFRKRTVKLVNAEIKKLIAQLELRNIPTAALTGWWTGAYGSISHMEDLRFKGLDEVSISFAGASPFAQDMDFPELKTEDGIPMIRNGIILTALADKGLALKAALQKANLSFHKIIFIDDDLTQIQSLEKICSELGIAFIGIHYREAKSIPLPQLNEKTEKLRFEILEKEHIWLSDKELELRRR